MIEELERIKKRLEKLDAVFSEENFFEIEKIDIYKIKDPEEIERIIELCLEIRDIAVHLKGPFGYIQYQVIEQRIKAEKYLEDLKQKALQKEELVFLFGFLFLFLAGNFYYFFHDFRIFLA